MSSKCNSQAGQLAGARLHHGTGVCQPILVVDDEVLIHRLNTGMLVLSCYEVEAAEYGAAAWDALQVKCYDLMITDNAMPIDADTKLGNATNL